MKMGAPTGGGEEKSPPEKKTKAGRGSIKKRLSIGYNFSSLRKRNPPKGVFEEDEGKKKAQPKTVSVKVGDLGWKQTTHVGQEEAQQLKALMSLMQQLGEEDTDDVGKLLEEWNKEKLQKEIEDKQRIKMQKNRALQLVMEQWNIDPDIISQPNSQEEEEGKDAREPERKRKEQVQVEVEGVKKKEEEERKDERGEKHLNTELGEEAVATGGSKKSNGDPESTNGAMASNSDGSADELTSSSLVIENDEEELMEVSEIGSEGNESEESEGRVSPRHPHQRAGWKHKRPREPRPPSVVFGKKKNLDLRDWQTFIDTERARIRSCSTLPHRMNSPRSNSPFTSPAGFLQYKHKHKLLGSSGVKEGGSRGGSGGSESEAGGDPDPSLPSSALAIHAPTTNAPSMHHLVRRRSFSDDESDWTTARRQRASSSEGVIELAEMSEGDDADEKRRGSIIITISRSPDPHPPKEQEEDDNDKEEKGKEREKEKTDTSGSVYLEAKSNASSSAMPQLFLFKQRKKEIRRISMSDSQLNPMKQGKKKRKHKKENGKEAEEEEEEEVKKERYEKMGASALRQVLTERDKEVEVLRKIIKDLKTRGEQANTCKKELQHALLMERERAEWLERREAALREMIEKKIGDRQRAKDEQEKEKAKREEREKKKSEKKEKKKSEKKEKRKGSFFASKEKEKEKREEKEKEKREEKEKEKEKEKETETEKEKEKLRNSREKNEKAVKANQPNEEPPQARNRGGTWTKSRGREVKTFKHLRSKSSEEVQLLPARP